MTFEYGRLKGRIIEKFGSQKKFAETMGCSEATITKKLTNSVGFDTEEIVLWCRTLSAYACEGTTRAIYDVEGGYSDQNTCDEATLAASAGAEVVCMLPNEWTTNIPEGWL